MRDAEIQDRINRLSAEAEGLYAGAGDGSGMDEDQRARLRAIEVERDRCYDLLNQREGRRDAGLPADQATPRSADVVESYEQ